eukprot:4606303-Alexandrium_andersonii.AAC.1
MVSDVLEALALPAVDVLASMSPATAAIISAAHANNWLTVQGTDLAVQYHVGSMPGDPWGDLVFELMQGRFAGNVRARLCQLDILPKVVMHGQGLVPERGGAQ